MLTMNEDALNDLKQFITATVSQQLDSQTEELRQEIKRLDDKLSLKIDTLSESVAQAINDSNDAVDTQLQDHEARITKLEPKPV